MQELSKILKSSTATVPPLSFRHATILSTSLQNAYQFVDVREPWEVEIASLPLFKTIPLGTLLDSSGTDLDVNKAAVLLCHHGVRSKRAAYYLLEHGFDHVFNVTGGIDAFSRTVDDSVPTY